MSRSHRRDRRIGLDVQSLEGRQLLTTTTEHLMQLFHPAAAGESASHSLAVEVSGWALRSSLLPTGGERLVSLGHQHGLGLQL